MGGTYRRCGPGKSLSVDKGSLRFFFVFSYNEIEGSYDSAIFTEEKHTSLDKAYEGKKSIVDYVYAKLPKGFHIPTPVGNYSPDWAIAFKEGTVKHVYFVAETKGSMSSLDLREIEKGKIASSAEPSYLSSNTYTAVGK